MTQSKTEKHVSHSYRLKGNLREGSIAGHLVRLTIPMIWGIAAIISFQLADMYFIGQLGLEALAAITFTFPVCYAFLTFMIAMGIAISSIVSRLIGEERKDETYIVTTHALMLAFIVGAILCFLGFSVIDKIFTTMGANDSQLVLIKDYMGIWLFSVPLLIVPMVGNSAIRAHGNTLIPAVVMTIIALINIILDPILIFGLWGAPEMGVQGAALATVISNFVALVVGIYIYIRVFPIMSLQWCCKLTGFISTAKKMMVIAIPVGLTQAIQPLVNAVVITLLANYGSQAVAAMGIASRIEAFAFIALMALSTGMAPVIGQNFGANKFDRVKETLKKAITFSCIWSFGIAFIVAVAGSFIAGFFTDDRDVIHLTQLFFWVVPFSYAFAHLVTGWSSAFNAMGLPQKSLMMIVVKMLILMIPAVYIGNMFGIIGIFTAIAVVNVVAGLFFHFWSKRHLDYMSRA